MELGLLLELGIGDPTHPSSAASLLDSAIEQVRLADRLGFESAWFVEHHFRESVSYGSAPELLIGALGKLTTRIRLGFGAVLAPVGTTPPVRIAEKVATADHVTGGRLEWASNLGSGTGRAGEGKQTGFGAPPSERSREIWADAIRATVAMWRPGPFTWQSEHLKFAEPTTIVPKPLQQPHPPAWSAGVDVASATFAGQGGFGLLDFPVLQPLAATEAAIRAYRSAAASPEPLTSTRLNRVATATTVVCTASGELPDPALAALRRWYRTTAEVAQDWGYEHLGPDAFPLLDDDLERGAHDQSILDLDMVATGDVDSCVRRLTRYADAGTDLVLCACDIGGLPHDLAMATIERLGTEVLPRLRADGRAHQTHRPART